MGKNQEAEDQVKERSREESLAMLGLEAEDARTATSLAAKTLCVPHDQPPLPAGTKCFFTGKPATCWCLCGHRGLRSFPMFPFKWPATKAYTSVSAAPSV